VHAGGRKEVTAPGAVTSREVKMASSQDAILVLCNAILFLSVYQQNHELYKALAVII
jgi:hypothetical protein